MSALAVKICVIALVAAALLCAAFLVLSQWAVPAALLPAQLLQLVGCSPPQGLQMRLRQPAWPIQPELLRAAQRAASPDNGLFLAVGGKANVMYELPLLVRSMRLVESADLSKHLVVVCNNEAALSACRRLHSNCLVDDWATTGSAGLVVGDSSRQVWSSAGFNKANWRRRELMNDIVRQGFKVVSLDMDVALFRNPLDPAVNPLADAELYMSEDAHYTNASLGIVNTGIIGMRDGPRSRAFMNAWLGSLKNLTPADKVPWEQQAATHLINTRPDLRENMRFLNSTYLPSLCNVNWGPKGPDQVAFEDSFARRNTATHAWDSMLGFHVPCCVNKRPTLNTCKRYAESALNAWLNQRNITEWQSVQQPQSGAE